MRKFLKNSILEIFQTIYEAHKIIRNFIKEKNYENAKSVLIDCQSSAAQICKTIENSDGNSCVTIGILKEYCDCVYDIFMSISKEANGREIKSQLDKQLDKVEKSVKNDIKVKLEIVFAPYKASMWDSLESIWKAANEDPDCDAYVVVAPYYDRNPDHSLGTFHYEGGLFPEYVPVIHYNKYNFKARKPDAIYIHYPYDNCNYVTTIDQRFYSFNLKKYTDKLVYIPYYATSGTMSDGQAMLSAYVYSDYMVFQSEKITSFVDNRIDRNKILTFGSPKFDKIINICENPPEPPENWKPFMEGKKVYFYNTSLGGLLENTRMFISKMKYVFETFARHNDVCLIWRPHPLFESTLKSMRSYALEAYNILKDFYICNNIGIYDDTPDVSNTIALCDAYIGDTSTSITSLFGVAGKPMFSLNNNITAPPSDEDWRGEYLNCYSFNESYLITKNNKLYYSTNGDFNYNYLCNLNNYTFGCQYARIIKVKNKTFILPSSSFDIIEIKNNGADHIKLKKSGDKAPWFGFCGLAGKYIFMCSLTYDYIFCFDTERRKIQYFKENADIYITLRNGEKLQGGFAVINEEVYLFSPVDNKVMIINPENGSQKVKYLNISNYSGCFTAYQDGNCIWMMPCEGKRIVLWNTETDEIKEYTDFPEDFICLNEQQCYQCLEKPFNNITRHGNYVYFSPYLANMFIRINTEKDTIEKWIPPFDIPSEYVSNCFFAGFKGIWLDFGESVIDMYYSCYDRKVYKVNFDENTCEEINICLNFDDLKKTESGFGVCSEWMGYCCNETYLNSLDKFLDDDLYGKPFNKEEQLENYSKITNGIDGTCGIKTHKFIKSNLLS